MNFRYLVGHISTFCPVNALKTECSLHWTVERETIVRSARNIVSIILFLCATLTLFRRVRFCRETGRGFLTCLLL